MPKEPEKISLSDFALSKKEPKKIPLEPLQKLEHENFETNSEKGIRQLEAE